jgi:hypothetical protein
MNDDMNFAAWMIGRDVGSTDTLEAREREHRRAILGPRRLTLRPSIGGRLSAAAAGLRAGTRPADTCCCPA